MYQACAPRGKTRHTAALDPSLVVVGSAQAGKKCTVTGNLIPADWTRRLSAPIKTIVHVVNIPANKHSKRDYIIKVRSASRRIGRQHAKSKSHVFLWLVALLETRTNLRLVVVRIVTRENEFGILAPYMAVIVQPYRCPANKLIRYRRMDRPLINLSQAKGSGEGTGQYACRDEFLPPAPSQTPKQECPPTAKPAPISNQTARAGFRNPMMAAENEQTCCALLRGY